VAEQRWKSVPPASSLPEPSASGQADRGDAVLWYASFGDDNKPAVMLIHGGGGSSDHWSHVVSDLAADYRVIVFDCRGQGRSTINTRTYSYARMADDAVAILDSLNILHAFVVGWSDGANIGFHVAQNYPERIRALVAFAGNASPAGYQPNVNPATLSAYMAMTNAEYRRLSPHPERRAELLLALAEMWKSQPALSAKALSAIKPKTFVLHAEHDEIVRRDHAEWIAKRMPNAEFALLPGVSHFAIFQDPNGFVTAIRTALRKARS